MRLPEEQFLGKVIAGVNRCVIDHDHRRTGQLLTKKIETMEHGLRINRALKGKRMKFVVQVEKAKDMLAWAVSRREFQGLPHFLPGVRDTRSEGEARFIKIPEIKLPVGLPGFCPECGQFGVLGAAYPGTPVSRIGIGCSYVAGVALNAFLPARGGEAVKVALELGGDINGANRNGETALHGAVHRDNPELVRFLVEAGARLDAKTAKGFTPLEWAVNGVGINNGPRPTAAATRKAWTRRDRIALDLSSSRLSARRHAGK